MIQRSIVRIFQLRTPRWRFGLSKWSGWSPANLVNDSLYSLAKGIFKPHGLSADGLFIAHTVVSALMFREHHDADLLKPTAMPQMERMRTDRTNE
jgi:hypothetical protein